MDQLVKRVLPVGARFSPVDRACRVIDFAPGERDVLAVALHRQLLQVRGEALQVLFVGQDRDGLSAEEIGIPDRQQRQEHRQIALERCSAEVLVHLVEAVQQSAKVLRTNGEHRRQTDRRVHRIAPAYPVPESEHVRGIDPELRHLPGVRGDGDEMPGHRLDVAAESREQPFPRALGIRHRLQRREGLRRDDEKRLRRIEVARCFDEVGAVDVRDEAKGHRAIAVVFERFIRHDGAEVGAADADVDHVANAFARVAGPRAAAHAVREVSHRVEHGVDFWNQVLAIDNDRHAAWRAQGDMQNGPVFGQVDLVSAKHGVDALAHA